MAFEPDNNASRVGARMTNIRIDAATAEVMRALEGAGTSSILLKGPALSDWYGVESARQYADCDLWVAPTGLRSAQRALADLGFAPTVDARGMPDWWAEHATAWWRALDGVEVDLHQTLQGVGVGATEAWKLLAGDTDAVVVAGYQARRLSAPGRALYVALHAAHHGEFSEKALPHLDAALSSAGEGIWRDACGLAVRLDALDAFATGLRLVASGAALADALGLPTTQSIEVALRASTPPPVALGFDQLATAGGWAARSEILARKLVPPPGFMRHWWPPAARSRPMLVLAYVYRPVWLLRNAPRGWRAWRAAKRQVDRGSRS